MAKFCTECGKEIATGVAFCTECGAKAPADPAPTTPAAAPETPPAAQPVSQQPQQTYQQPRQTYQQPAPQPVRTGQVAVADPTSKVVGTGAFFGLMFLFALPIIGFLACIIMAFAPKNKNLKNFARAMLIWMIIALVIGGLLFALISMVMGPLMAYINQMIGDLGESFGQFSEFGDAFNEFGNIAEQFGNGDLSGLPIE